jgi:hypothetical protein
VMSFCESRRPHPETAAVMRRRNPRIKTLLSQTSVTSIDPTKSCTRFEQSTTQASKRRRMIVVYPHYCSA